MGRWRTVRVVVATAVVAAVAVGLAAPAGATRTSTATAAAPAAGPPCPTPFTDAFQQELQSRWPDNRFTAAVVDRRTGCEHHLRPDLRITTASVFKIEVMAGVWTLVMYVGLGAAPLAMTLFREVR